MTLNLPNVPVAKSTFINNNLRPELLKNASMLEILFDKIGQKCSWSDLKALVSELNATVTYGEE